MAERSTVHMDMKEGSEDMAKAMLYSRLHGESDLEVRHLDHERYQVSQLHLV